MPEPADVAAVELLRHTAAEKAKIDVAAAAELLSRTAVQKAKINDFIISLLEDPARLAKFREDPDSLLKEADIPPQIGEILKFGDRLAVLREATGGGRLYPPSAYATFPCTIVVSSAITILVLES